MNKKYLVILASMLLLASCNDSQGDTNGASGEDVSCKPECLDGFALVCSAEGESSWVYCEHGCTGDTCDPAPGGTKCHAMCANGVATICNANGSSELAPCPYGCAGDACSGPRICKPECKDGVALECGSDGSFEYVNCLLGCDGVACAQAPEITGPCKGVVCENAGSCDRGICVSNNMAAVAEDDKCDKWFQGYCDGDIKVTCEGGKIHYAYCGDVNGCAMSKLKHYGETYLIPTCRKDGASCRSGMNSYCVTENNGGKSEAHTYAIACWDNTDDTMSGDKGNGDYLLCAANGCNPQKTTCWNKCSGETLLVYDESTQNCAAINQICVTEEQNGFCADACWQDGETLLSCFQGNERRRECHKDDNGKLYYVDEIFPCDHGCDESTGKCKKIVHDEYSACDWNSFKQRCEKGIRVSCYEGIVRAEKCSDNNQFCAVSENAAVCYDCKHEFNKTTGECSKVVADEYTPCEKSSFKERCEDGNRVICEDGIVRAVQCDGGKSCGVIGNRASCTEACERAESSYCEGNKLITQICKPNEAGILVPSSQTEVECPDRCDANKKACTCSQGGYWCENNAITHCDPVSETLVFESCGSKFCGAMSSSKVECFDKRYNSLDDCENDYGCNGKTYHEAACVSIPNETWIYGKVSSEYCDTGCSRDDMRCCAASEYYNSTQNACVCDAQKHWTGTAGNCRCAKGYEEKDDRCESICPGLWSEKEEKCCNANKEYVNAQGACACNTSGHWTGTAGNCKCATGYQLNASGTSCGKISCPAHSTFNESANKCVCDAHYAFNSAGTACECDSNSGYIASGNTCVCAFGYKQNSSTNSCVKLSPGDTVNMGTYKYKADGSDGYLKWTVIKVEGDKMFLLSSAVIDSWLFGYYYYSNSFVRDSLDDFYDDAFNLDEKNRILSTEIGFYYNNSYNTVTDKVFLLSEDEYEYVKSLEINMERAKGTPYNCALTNQENGCYGSWWLRDGGSVIYYAYYVTTSKSGKTTEISEGNTSDIRGIRPAMWVKIGGK